LSENSGYLPTPRHGVLEKLYPSDGFAPDGYVRLREQMSIFDKSDSREIVLPVGMSLSEMALQELGGRLSDRHVVTVGDQIVSREHWETTVPESGQLVHFVEAPGGTELIIASLVATLVSVSLTVAGAITGNSYLMIAGAAVGLLSMGLGAWGVGAAPLTSVVSNKVLVAGSGIALGAANVLAGFIARPQRQKGRDSGFKASPHLVGLRNTIRKFDPVPKVLGKVRVAPPYGQHPYARVIGEDRFFFGRFIVSKGPTLISDIKIGETPLENYYVSDGYQSMNFPHLTHTGSSQPDAGDFQVTNLKVYLRSGDYKYGVISSQGYLATDSKMWLFPYKTTRTSDAEGNFTDPGQHQPWTWGEREWWDARKVLIPTTRGDFIARWVTQVCMPPHPSVSVTSTIVSDTFVHANMYRTTAWFRDDVPSFRDLEGMSGVAGETWLPVTDASEFLVNDWIEVPIKNQGDVLEWDTAPISELDSTWNTNAGRYLGGYVTAVDTASSPNRIRFRPNAKYSSAPYAGTVPANAPITMCWGGDNAHNGNYASDTDSVSYQHRAYLYAGTSSTASSVNQRNKSAHRYSEWDSARLYRFDRALGTPVKFEWHKNLKSLKEDVLFQQRTGFPEEPRLNMIQESVYLDDNVTPLNSYTGGFESGLRADPKIRTSAENATRIRVSFSLAPMFYQDKLDGDKHAADSILHFAIRETPEDSSGSTPTSPAFGNDFRCEAGGQTSGWVTGARTKVFRGEGISTPTIAVKVSNKSDSVKNVAFDIIPDSASPSSGKQYDVKVGVDDYGYKGKSNFYRDIKWIGLESTLTSDAVIESDLSELQIRLKENSLVEDLNCVAQSLIAYYDGSSWVEPVFNMDEAQLTKFQAASDNPAWQIADIVRGKACAKPVDDRYIDGDSFLEFANWCDNPYTGEAATVGNNVGDGSSSYAANDTEVDLTWGEFWATRDDLTMTEKLPATSAGYTSEYWETVQTPTAIPLGAATGSKFLHATIRRPTTEASHWDTSDWSFQAEIIASDSSTTGVKTAPSVELVAGDWVTLTWDFTDETVATTANDCKIRIFGLTNQQLLPTISEIATGWTGHTTAQISRVWIDDSSTGNGTSVFDHSFFLKSNVLDNTANAIVRWRHALILPGGSNSYEDANVSQLPFDPLTFSYNGIRLHNVKFTQSSGGALTETKKAVGTLESSASYGASYRLSFTNGLEGAVAAGSTAYELFLPMRCNAVVDYSTTAADIMEQIAAVGWGSVHYRDSKIGITIDKPRKSQAGVADTPVTLITPRNTKAGSLRGTRQFPEIAHATRVNFQTEKGVTSERIVYRPGYASAAGDGVKKATIFDQMDTWGVVDPDQAYQMAKFNIIARDYRNEVIEVELDLENLWIERGDLVEFSHDTPMIGTSYARLTAVALDGSNELDTITTDEPSTLEFGKAYGVRIRSADGQFVTTPVTNPATSGNPSVSTKTLTVTGSIAASSAPEAGDLVAFGELGVETNRMVVIGISPTDDLSARITMVSEAADMWPALRQENSIRPTYTPGTQITDDTKPGEPTVLGWIFGPDFVDIDLATKSFEHVPAGQIEGAWRDNAGGSWNPTVTVMAEATTTIRFEWPYTSNQSGRGKRWFQFRAIRSDTFSASNWTALGPLEPELDAAFIPNDISTSHLEAAVEDGDWVLDWELNIGSAAPDTLTESENVSASIDVLRSETPVLEGRRPAELSRYVTNFRIIVIEWPGNEGLHLAPNYDNLPISAHRPEGKWFPSERRNGWAPTDDFVNSSHVKVREESVGGDVRNWRYTHEMNAADHDGVASRGVFQFNVIPVVEKVPSLGWGHGRKYETKYDPPPPTPTLSYISQPMGRAAVDFEFAGQVKNPDVEGILIWATETSGFKPMADNLVYSGPASDVVSVIGLAPTRTYFRWATFDKFYRAGDPPSTLHVHPDEATFSPVAASGTSDIAVGDMTNLFPDPSFNYVGGSASLKDLFSVYTEGRDPYMTHPLSPDGVGEESWGVVSMIDPLDNLPGNLIYPKAGTQMLSFNPAKSLGFDGHGKRLFQFFWQATGNYADGTAPTDWTKFEVGAEIEWQINNTGPTYYGTIFDLLLDESGATQTPGVIEPEFVNCYAHQPGTHPIDKTEDDETTKTMIRLRSDPTNHFGRVAYSVNMTGGFSASNAPPNTMLLFPKFESRMPLFADKAQNGFGTSGIATAFSWSTSNSMLPADAQIMSVRPGDQFELDLWFNRTRWFYGSDGRMFNAQLVMYDGDGYYITKYSDDGGSTYKSTGTQHSMECLVASESPASDAVGGFDLGVQTWDTWISITHEFTVPSHVTRATRTVAEHVEHGTDGVPTTVSRMGLAIVPEGSSLSSRLISGPRWEPSGGVLNTAAAAGDGDSSNKLLVDQDVSNTGTLPLRVAPNGRYNYDVEIELDDGSTHGARLISTTTLNSDPSTTEVEIAPVLSGAAGIGKRIYHRKNGEAVLLFDQVEFKPVTQSRGIATSAVVADKIGASAVVAEKLATGSVETAKILDANVTTPKIAADSVTTRATVKTSAVQTSGTINSYLQTLSVENADTATRPVEVTWTGEIYRPTDYSTNADWAPYFSCYTYSTETTLAAAWPSGTSSIQVSSVTGFAVGDKVSVGLHTLNQNITHGWEIQSIYQNIITFTQNNFWAATSGALVFKEDDIVLSDERVVPAETTGTGALQSFSFSALSTLPSETTSKILFSFRNNGNNFWQHAAIAAGAHYDAKVVKR